MNRRILKLTVPTVVSNISVPLLGLTDTAVSGHMGGEKYLASIAIGSVMMTTIYWLFSFLRAGTSGITATAYGAQQPERIGNSLLRSVMLGGVIGTVIIVLQMPLLKVLSLMMGASANVTELSGEYFKICVWGAVPMMIITAMSGWFVGMQATGKAMWVNIGVSLLNVAFTLLFVYGFGIGFRGLAYGTLAAQWVILIPATIMARRLLRRNEIKLKMTREAIKEAEEWKEMFNVNSNLFFRSACLIAITAILYAISARMGDVVTGANAVINQLFLFFSFFMDGFAYTGEALVGRYYGAGDSKMLRLSITELMKWGAGVTLIFVVLYGTCLRDIVGILSESAAIEESVMNCRWWVVAIPVAGSAAFIYDGFFIGLTKTFPMLLSTLCGVILFVVLIMLTDKAQETLWMSFTFYLGLRSIILIATFPIKKKQQ